MESPVLTTCRKLSKNEADFIEQENELQHRIVSSASLVDLMSSELLRVPPSLFHPQVALTLVRLNLSRNRIKDLPPLVGDFPALQHLNVSRNGLKLLPADLGRLRSLVTLNALSNALRPHARSVPLEALGGLPLLELLDLRFNDKIKGEATATALRAGLPPQVLIQLTTPGEGEGGVKHIPHSQRGIIGNHACDRDATLLRSQLEPYSTPMLRRRLKDEFNQPTDPEVTERAEVMELLLQAYVLEGPRIVRQVEGTPISTDLYELVLTELHAYVAGAAATGQLRERPKIKAQSYMILRSPAEFSKKDGAKAKLAAAKVAKYQKMWNLAERVIAEAKPEFSKVYTAVAFTHNFQGSPHIDTQNIGPFCGIALGDFEQGGGALCVESGPREVTAVDTRGRVAMVDGRYPHWVAPYSHGTRFSIIFYQTLGEGAPQGPAVLVA